MDENTELEEISEVSRRISEYFDKVSYVVQEIADTLGQMFPPLWTWYDFNRDMQLAYDMCELRELIRKFISRCRPKKQLPINHMLFHTRVMCRSPTLNYTYSS